MGTRTVRLDDETEKTLGEIREITGLSVSAVLKRGLTTLRNEIAKETSTRPYDIYARLDLGPGGYASASAARAKGGVRDVIRRKLER